MHAVMLERPVVVDVRIYSQAAGHVSHTRAGHGLSARVSHRSATVTRDHDQLRGDEVSSLREIESERREGDGAPAPPRLSGLRWTVAARVLAIVVGVVLAIEGLRLAKPVLVPLVAGIFLAILARPLHTRVRAGLPRRIQWVGLLVALLAIVAGVALFAGAMALSGRAIAQDFRARRPQIESQMQRARARVERTGVPVPSALGGGGDSPSSSGASQSRESGAVSPRASTDSSGAGSTSSGFASRAFRAIAEGLAGLLLALGFAALGLAEADEVRKRLAHLGKGDGARRTLAAIDEAAPAFRRYVWVKSLTSAITGIATWLVALAFGLPLAWVWGFLAFLLEYVPSIGSLLAVLPPTLMALAEGGPGRAAAVLLVVGALQVILGNVVDPRIEGRLMAVSPFGVLLSIVFWGWLWGPVGALLAVPLTVGIVIACRHIPGAHGFATVVAGDGVPGKDRPQGTSAA